LETMWRLRVVVPRAAAGSIWRELAAGGPLFTERARDAFEVIV
jgi:hypothetical protein